jgi:polyhydroxybutyrate depolymerase
MRRVLTLFLAAALAGAACSSTAATSTPTTEHAASSTASTPSVSSPDPATTHPATTEAATTEPETTEPETTEPDTTEPDTTGDSVPTDRPFQVFVPTSYDTSKPMPLVLLLHGYSASGAIQEAYFGLQPLAEQRGFLYVHPDGTKDRLGNQFWTATNACCGFGSTVDDSSYLMSVIHQVERDYNVDRKRIFLIGHSNGGFMSYRMACDHADTIAAIVSMAGATFADTSKCTPSEAVSVLQIHGTSDQTIQYGGGDILGERYPSADATVATWAGYDHCGAAPVASAQMLDIAAQIAGDETTVESFPGCPAGVDVELWTVAGGPHVPALSTTFATNAIDFLLSHPKS